MSVFCMFGETFVRLKRANSHRLFSQARRFCKRKPAKNIKFYARIEIKSYGVRFNNPSWSRRAVKIAHQADKSFRRTYDFKSSVQTSRMSLRFVMEPKLKQQTATEVLKRNFRRTSTWKVWGGELRGGRFTNCVGDFFLKRPPWGTFRTSQ